MKIERLQKHHDRTDFNCEEESLTLYIKTQVSQDVKKKLAVCFVGVDNHNKILGYYTLTSESLGREMLPDSHISKVPKNYNAPVILLGRLARDISQKGKGIGELLLIDALLRSYRLSNESIGAMAVVVDPINQNAIDFYKEYGFIQLPDSEKMFLPMKIIAKLTTLIRN
ncbi:MAG: GNAT family N-acetyltransferase [Crocinitomicaceae bacterium]|nr:GNAT family N-acetyltransferase [Crocinitomicaceae bacterium]